MTACPPLSSEQYVDVTASGLRNKLRFLPVDGSGVLGHLYKEQENFPWTFIRYIDAFRLINLYYLSKPFDLGSQSSVECILMCKAIFQILGI